MVYNILSMTLKLLQLNIFQGKYIDNIIKFVKENDVDILCLQEVTGGGWSHGGENYYPDMDVPVGKPISASINLDCFAQLRSQLNYDGELIKYIALKKDKNSYQSNAIFYKNLTLKNHTEIWMLPYQEYEKVEDAKPDTQPRAALNLEFEVDGREFNVITSHMAWGRLPIDEDYKVEQAKKLHDELAKITNPFIFTADFNVTAETKTARTFDDLAKNLTEEAGIVNTLNNRTHVVQKLFPPGLAVDFVFVTPQIKLIYPTTLDYYWNLKYNLFFLKTKTYHLA